MLENHFESLNGHAANGHAPSPEPATPSAEVWEWLTDMQKAIMDAMKKANGVPLYAKKLARLAGYAYSGPFRTAVRQLCDNGLIVRTMDGFILASGSPLNKTAINQREDIARTVAALIRAAGSPLTVTVQAPGIHLRLSLGKGVRRDSAPIE